MSEEQNELDTFFTSSNNTPQPEEKEISSSALEDEFSRLLNSFIEESNSSTVSIDKSLDDFLGPTEEPKDTSSPSSLDSFVTTSAINSIDDDRINNLFENTEDADNIIQKTEEQAALKQDEFELSRAIANFQDGIYALSDKKNLKIPTTDYNHSQLNPNYKPSVGKKIAKYLLECWDIINKYDPENMKRLSKNATDEDFLIFAESLSDTDMQLVIISYVEILINLEMCEVKYEQMKEISIKNRIKKELYDEYLQLQERKAKFIKCLKEQNFPIDVDRLINNYFKAAQNDTSGAYKALTKNPAMFSPIQMDKIKPKFFGLVKVSAEDGIKMNQKIGKFIKKLKI